MEKDQTNFAGSLQRVCMLNMKDILRQLGCYAVRCDGLRTVWPFFHPVGLEKVV